MATLRAFFLSSDVSTVAIAPPVLRVIMGWAPWFREFFGFRPQDNVESCWTEDGSSLRDGTGPVETPICLGGMQAQERFTRRIVLHHLRPSHEAQGLCSS